MNVPAERHVEGERSYKEDRKSKRVEDLEWRTAAGAGHRVPAQATPCLSDGLAQLNALHDRGALSDGEFAEARTRLLGG